MKMYGYLKARTFLSMLAKGKISFSKILNALNCYWAYFRKDLKAGRFPVVMFIDISNRCNLFCTSCRTTPAKIIDQNPEGNGSPIPVGSMPLETCKKIILEARDHLLLAVLYVNGEPLMHKDLFNMLKFSKDQKVATMVSTNAMLLDENNALALLSSGVDFIKIAVSGYYQPAYSVYHRGGDIEAVKRNVENLMELRKRSGEKPLVLLDYIVFKHNKHEIDLFREFCERLGVIFNIRAGISQGQAAVSEVGDKAIAPAAALCDWLWKVMVVNWDGNIFPCCEFTTWSSPVSLGVYGAGNGKLESIWNGSAYQNFRKIHLTSGRNVVKRCQGCHYQGLGLQA